MKAFRAILAMTAAVAVALPLRADLEDGIKAVVHDSVVTKSEVESYTLQAAEELRRQYRTQPAEYEKRLTTALGENLETLLERQLILHDFKAGGYNLPESIIDEAVQERIRARFGGREKLTKTLQAQGQTYERFRQQIREQIIVEALRGKNVSQEIIVSPHKIESYYLAHKDSYKVEDEIKLRMIVLLKSSDDDAEAVRKLAAEIRGKIKDGAAFSEMANVYSQGRQGREGGDWGWIERQVLREELRNVAFALKPGELSDPLEVGNACYLMLVEDKRATHIKSLSEVRDDVENALKTEERARLQKAWIERLKKKTFVRYF